LYKECYGIYQTLTYKEIFSFTNLDYSLSFSVIFFQLLGFALFSAHCPQPELSLLAGWLRILGMDEYAMPLLGFSLYTKDLLTYQDDNTRLS
jgi:hypothetical protein